MAGLLVCLLALVACSGERPDRSGDGEPGRSASPSSRPDARPLPAEPAARAAALASRLSDVDLVGQMLMPAVHGTDADRVTPQARRENTARTGVATPGEIVRRYRLGGLILVRRVSDDPTTATNPTTNIVDPPQVRRFTTGLQRHALHLPAGVPLLIGADQEHGVVTRIRRGITRLPSAMAFGAGADPDQTEQAAFVSGTELAALGILVDFAPVADVTGGPGNAVIGSRSYGDEPGRVGPQVAATVRGYQRAGVAAALKHFPGHGHTSTDTHERVAVLGQSRAALDRNDLAPFRAGIDAGARLVMSGHLDVRAVDPGVPASLSRRVLVDLLRGQLGFTGVVVTDGLEMKALTDRFPAGEAAVRAVLAGNDLLLLTPDLRAAQRGLLDALASGRLPRARAVEAVTRILTLKFDPPHGGGDAGTPAAPAGTASATPPSATGPAPSPSPPSPSPPSPSPPSPSPPGPRPWHQPPLRVVGLPAHRAVADRAAAAAVTLLRGRCGGPLVRGPITVTGGSQDQRAALEAALRAAGRRIGPGGDSVHLAGYGDGAGDLRPATVTVATDTPYVLAAARSPVLLATYSGVDASLRALAAVLTGRARPTGRAPVAVTGLPRTRC